MQLFQTEVEGTKMHLIARIVSLPPGFEHVDFDG